LYFFPLTVRSFECLTLATTFLEVISEFQGHGVNTRVTTAKKQPHAGMCTPLTQFNFMSVIIFECCNKVVFI